jgi:hypothetical protein
MPKAKTTQSSTEPEVVGSQKAYDRFLPAAQALGVVRPYRGDAQLAFHNIDRGLDAVDAKADVIKAQLPTVDVKKLHELPEIALAVIYAAAQVDRSSDGATPALLVKARELRDLMLTSAEALAKARVLPARDVAKIRSGLGPIDSAQDCVDLAALFTKHAKDVKGKTAVTAAHIKQAATVGTDLLKRLKGKRTRTKPNAGVVDAVDARDRLWTLLVDRHRELRRVGMWIWVDEVDEHVPPLQSRMAPPKKRPAKKVAAQPKGDGTAQVDGGAAATNG